MYSVPSVNNSSLPRNGSEHGSIPFGDSNQARLTEYEMLSAAMNKANSGTCDPPKAENDASMPRSESLRFCLLSIRLDLPGVLVHA